MSSTTHSPDHDMANCLSAQMPPAQLIRRTSRSSGSQSGYRISRVEKPKSNHNSPRTLERRKTTAGTKRYATLDDHFNMMFGLSGEQQEEEDRRQAARPVSWHPSTQSRSASRPSTLVVQTSGQDWSRHSTHGSDFYSLSARSPYPGHLQNYAAYTPSQDTHRDSQDSEQSWQSQTARTYTISAFSTPAIEPMPWYLKEWARKNQAEAHNGSSDFLPIQHPTTSEADADADAEGDEEMEDSGKELVGMGLYDLPEPSLSWNSSTLLEGTGKGLKLEETWQPPEENSDEEEEDDASSDDGSIEDPPEAKEDTPLPIMPTVKPETPSSLEGQSFFFDEEESYTKEWYFQQLKQPPPMPVRDAGVGYGWI